jgi:hypothetical protein
VTRVFPLNADPGITSHAAPERFKFYPPPLDPRSGRVLLALALFAGAMPTSRHRPVCAVCWTRNATKDVALGQVCEVSAATWRSGLHTAQSGSPSGDSPCKIVEAQTRKHEHRKRSLSLGKAEEAAITSRRHSDRKFLARGCRSIGRCHPSRRR